MTEEQKKRAACFRALAAVLRDFDADIDLRDEGCWESYQRIDINVGPDTTELGERIDADILTELAENLER